MAGQLCGAVKGTLAVNLASGTEAAVGAWGVEPAEVVVEMAVERCLVAGTRIPNTGAVVAGVIESTL